MNEGDPGLRNGPYPEGKCGGTREISLSGVSGNSLQEVRDEKPASLSTWPSLDRGLHVLLAEQESCSIAGRSPHQNPSGETPRGIV